MEFWCGEMSASLGIDNKATNGSVNVFHGYFNTSLSYGAGFSEFTIVACSLLSYQN